MSAGAHDIVIEQGAAFTRELVYKDANGDEVNISNWTIRMQIRRYKRSTTCIADLDNKSKGGLRITSGIGGAFTLCIPGDLTGTFNFSIGCYDICLVGGGGGPVRLLEGKVTLNKSVTERAWQL
jgi:hypothetical protein